MRAWAIERKGKLVPGSVGNKRDEAWEAYGIRAWGCGCVLCRQALRREGCIAIRVTVSASHKGRKR